MKYLIVIFVVVLVVWLMLRGRDREAPRARAKPRGAAPKAMVQCKHCGVHLPHADAVQDSRGDFCSEAHRLAGPSER